MKKLVVILLVAAMALSLSVTAMAGNSPTNSGSSSTTTSSVPATGSGPLEIFNSDDVLIATVPSREVTKITVGNANRLSGEDKDAFLAAYEDAKNVEGKVVKYFYWFDIPEHYKELEDFCYARYWFGCTGKNVELTVNGNPMEVVNVRTNYYYAKLTEFGSLAILCD